MMRPSLLIAAAALLLSAGGTAADATQYGASPELPEPQRGLLPTMKIPRPANWGDARPTVPQGYRIEPIATDLRIPRQTLVLPNGDIRSPRAPAAVRRRCVPRTSSRTSSRAWARPR
jgi:glucose/arabinose dehydrogenase